MGYLLDVNTSGVSFQMSTGMRQIPWKPGDWIKPKSRFYYEAFGAHVSHDDIRMGLDQNVSYGQRFEIWFEYWFPLVLAAIPPTWLLLRNRRNLLNRYERWRVRSRGLCAACGYDLRATPDRCPECGNSVAHNATSGVSQ